jgi:hypothetical protein
MVQLVLAKAKEGVVGPCYHSLGYAILGFSFSFSFFLIFLVHHHLPPSLLNYHV